MRTTVAAPAAVGALALGAPAAGAASPPRDMVFRGRVTVYAGAAEPPAIPLEP